MVVLRAEAVRSGRGGGKSFFFFSPHRHRSLAEALGITAAVGIKSESHSPPKNLALLGRGPAFGAF